MSAQDAGAAGAAFDAAVDIKPAPAPVGDPVSFARSSMEFYRYQLALAQTKVDAGADYIARVLADAQAKVQEATALRDELAGMLATAEATLAAVEPEVK